MHAFIITWLSSSNVRFSPLFGKHWWNNVHFLEWIDGRFLYGYICFIIASVGKDWRRTKNLTGASFIWYRDLINIFRNFFVYIFQKATKSSFLSVTLVSVSLFSIITKHINWIKFYICMIGIDISHSRDATIVMFHTNSRDILSSFTFWCIARLGWEFLPVVCGTINQISASRRQLHITSKFCTVILLWFFSFTISYPLTVYKIFTGTIIL